MKHTKQNIITLLTEISNNYYQLAKFYEENGKEVDYRKHLSISTAIDSTIRILESKYYFDRMCDIYIEDNDIEKR